MKVGIITFQETNNYGAVLQNYALQQAIVQKGHTVETIDYKSNYIGRPYRLIHLKNKGIFSYLFGLVGYLIYMPRTKKCKRFRRNIHYSGSVTSDNIDGLEQKYDTFITGSDQVWNYKLTGMDTIYMLDFVKDKSKCNSYAASIGLLEIDDAKKEQYISLLENFHYITVREKSASVLLENILCKNITVVSDPCLLLSKEKWASVAAAPHITSKYVFVYQLGVSSDAVRLARRIAKEQSLKLVFVPFPVGAFSSGKWDFCAGNAELIGYIKNAEYIVTDSFHGTLLSIIFNKNFFTKISGTHAGVGSRIHDLLEHYGLNDRIIQENIDYRQPISYAPINVKLKEDRIFSMEILDKILALPPIEH